MNGKNLNECVVFLHGLGRTGFSFRKAEKFFEAAGYRTLNISYPSTKHGIEKLTESFIGPRLQDPAMAGFDRVHFLTHSLGGIIVRFYLGRHKIENLGRVVMLAPPNQGSRLADSLSGWSFFDFFCGPALEELTTGEKSVVKTLKPVDFDLGIITGEVSLNPLFSYLIGERSDGKVSLSEARAGGEKDFLVVKRSHTFIMRAPEVLEAAKRFIETGSFKSFA